jgi:methionyl aminopeptidase
VTRLRPNDPCWCGSNKKYKKCHMARDRVSTLAQQERGRNRPANPIKAGTISPMRSVPAHIVLTDYAESGKPAAGKGFSILPEGEELAKMRRSCQAARRILQRCLDAIKPGVTTDAIDAIAHLAYIDEGGYPSTLNYHGYPKSICSSVNEVICHGIPDDRALEDGDIVNIDVTIYLDGYHGDCSAMALVGNVADERRKLVTTTEQAMWTGIGTARAGARLNEIGRAIERTVSGQGYSVVRAFVGHGVGERFHMEPQVPHYFDQAQDLILEPDMVFTIEPMINMGTWQHRMWDDNWTAVTADLQCSAQFERTIRITDGTPEVLTVLPDETIPL